MNNTHKHVQVNNDLIGVTEDLDELDNIFNKHASSKPITKTVNMEFNGK